jgi:hypothetical protein
VNIAEILLKVALNTKHQKIKSILKGKKHKLYGRDSVTSILRGPTIKPRLCRSLCVNLAFFLASVPMQSLKLDQSIDRFRKMANTGMKDGDPEIESLKQEDKVSTLAFFRCICFLVTSRYINNI